MLKICNLYLVTFLKMQPMFHATLHSSTSPVVYQQEVSSLPQGIFFFAAKVCLACSRHSGGREWVKNQLAEGKKLMREKIQVFRWWGAGKKLVGRGQKKFPCFFFPYVPFVLDAYDLTLHSPQHLNAWNRLNCFELHSR